MKLNFASKRFANVKAKYSIHISCHIEMHTVYMFFLF